MKQAHEGFVAAHELLAKLAYGLILLHVAAALRHMLVLKDGVMGRMVPFLRAPA
jgi:cytochrome b561